MDDPDFSFEKQQRERRRKLAAPKLKRPKPSWKISGQDKKPPEKWRIERDSKGKISVMEETQPPAIQSGGPHRPSARSKFTIRLWESCLVGGYAAEAGTQVICYGPTAGCLSGRGKILHEERRAF